MVASSKPKMRVHNGERPWRFANISTPQHTKDVKFRKMVRAQAARHHQNKTPTSQCGKLNGSLVGSTSKDTTKLSASSSSASLDHVDEGGQNTQVQTETVVWPNQMDQLVMEAQRLCDSLSPLTDLGNTRESLPNRGADTPYHVYSPFPNYVKVQAVPVANPCTLLASGNLDPFDSFSIEYCPEDFELLHHYCNVLAPSILPIDRGNGLDVNPLCSVWVPLMMRDAALFHGTMAYAAGHLDMLLERQPRPETLMKKTQAIRMIKERISCETEASSNSTIGAIAMLASLERAKGDLEGLHIHESAIEKLVGLRGGLMQLGCRVLEAFISSGDLLTATMLIRPPQFENYPSFTDVQNIFPYSNMPLLDPSEKAGSQEHLATIYRQLRFLTARMLEAGSSNGPISESEMMIFYDARSLIEHSLLSMSATAATSQGRDMDSRESQRLAALIYLNAVLRNCSPNGALMQSLRKQLIHAIQAVKEPALFLNLKPRTAIWIYSMGGLISLYKADKHWFAERIARTMADAKINSWEEVKRTHREAVWVDELKTKTWNSLWGEVQEIQNPASASKDAAGAGFEYTFPAI